VAKPPGCEWSEADWFTFPLPAVAHDDDIADLAPGLNLSVGLDDLVD
jgi:hypothetical protein